MTNASRSSETEGENMFAAVEYAQRRRTKGAQTGLKSKPGVEERRRSVGILRHECGGRKNERVEWECDVERARCLVVCFAGAANAAAPRGVVYCISRERGVSRSREAGAVISGLY